MTNPPWIYATPGERCEACGVIVNRAIAEHTPEQCERFKKAAERFRQAWPETAVFFDRQTTAVKPTHKRRKK